MKIKLRRSNQNDLDKVYNLHIECFNNSDLWYRSNIQHYLNSGIIIEKKSLNSSDNEIIGILLQGSITPCNQKIEIESDQEYKGDIFEPINDKGIIFDPFKEYYGIVMICIHPKYRGKGLGKKLIEKHFNDNKNITLCLNTRRSNINAYQLYKKMGYEHIAFIKNKYFLPSEDSVFMVKV
jgi:ribosomal protein S18 acetylase RimI-like enzyme